MKKFLFVLCSIFILIPSVFIVSGCSNSDLKTEIQSLKEEISVLNDQVDNLENDLSSVKNQNTLLNNKLNSSTLYYELEKETELSVNVSLGTKFLILNTSNSSFLYFDSENTISIKIKNFTGSEFVDYENISSNNYTTPGSGIYQIEIIQINNAEKDILKLFLTDNQR